MRIFHFADAHIDMVTTGKQDARSGLPVRALDYLKALDTIIQAAITERADLVIFAGDAYKDRTPVPTYQREWGRRVIRLSQAGIPTILLTGNHDVSPASGRAHTLQEFATLQVPHIHVVSQARLLKAEDLGIPVQVLALPWLNKSMVSAGMAEGADLGASNEVLAAMAMDWIQETIEKNCNPDLPLVLAAHASIEGALIGAERMISLGNEFILPPGFVRNRRFNYVALGHIHKAQNMNEGAQPPVIYPGSIERIDFGEVADDKFYVVATLESGRDTVVEWRRLEGRRFIDLLVRADQGEPALQSRLIAALPPAPELEGAIVRLVVEYHGDLESQIDEAELRRRAASALEFHFVRRPVRSNRSRIGDVQVNAMSAAELLDVYLRSLNYPEAESAELLRLGADIIQSAHGLEEPSP